VRYLFVTRKCPTPSNATGGSAGQRESGLLPRRALHDLCAAASGELGSPGTRWSACHGSSNAGPCPHRWHTVAVFRIHSAWRLYALLYSWAFLALRPGVSCLIAFAWSFAVWCGSQRVPLLRVPHSMHGLLNAMYGFPECLLYCWPQQMCRLLLCRLRMLCPVPGDVRHCLRQVAQCGCYHSG